MNKPKLYSASIAFRLQHVIVVCENVVAFVICKCFLDKIGGDNLNDLKSNYNTYIKVRCRGWKDNK